jgi:hypothetical protein
MRASVDDRRAGAGAGGAAGGAAGHSSRRAGLNFLGTTLATTGIIATVGLSMFPFILPSSIDPHSSLTVWNASSSHTTLFIMLIVTIIFLPIVLTLHGLGDEDAGRPHRPARCAHQPRLLLKEPFHVVFCMGAGRGFCRGFRRDQRPVARIQLAHRRRPGDLSRAIA